MKSLNTFPGNGLNQEPVPAGSETQDDEISLIDLFAVLWRRRVMIIVITALAAVGVAGFAIASLVLPPDISPLPNEYTSTALMLISDANSSGGGISSVLNASGLGSLAGLAGVSSGSTFSGLAVYLVNSNAFLDSVVDQFGLIERWEIEKFVRASSRKALTKKLVAAFDDKSGVFNISFTDTDPEFAQTVANYAVSYLVQYFDVLGIDKNKLEKDNLERNIEYTLVEIQKLETDSHRLEQSLYGSVTSIPAITFERNRIAMELEAQQKVYSQLKVQYELLKVSMASEKPAFQVLEMAEVPDMKSGPGRGLLCIIVTFAAGFFSVFLAFVMNAIANIKNDPEAMEKLRGASHAK